MDTPPVLFGNDRIVPAIGAEARHQQILNAQLLYDQALREQAAQSPLRSVPGWVWGAAALAGLWWLSRR